LAEALTEVVPTVAVAFTVNAPACVPAAKVTEALPLASVIAVRDEGENTPELSVVEKVTTVLATAAPFVSFSVTFTTLALSGVRFVVVVPLLSVSDMVMEGAKVPEPGLVLAPQPGSTGLRVGSTLTQLPPGPPLLPPQATSRQASSKAPASETRLFQANLFVIAFLLILRR
jgi:hypothetical protein